MSCTCLASPTRNANTRFNNAGIAGEGSREGYEKIDDVEKYSQQLLRSEFKEWDDILRTNVTAHYVSSQLAPSSSYRAFS